MRRPYLAVVALGAAVAVVIGLRACMPNSSDPGSRQPRETTPDATADVTEDGLGPRSVINGVPQGWSRDEAGARAAAISAVSLTGDIARAGFITRADMIEALATRRYGPTLAATSAAQLDEMTGELDEAEVTPASVVFSELPLTAKVITASDTRCRVDVWSVLVVAVPGQGAPRQAWRSVTIDLAWENDDWRIDGWTALPGPSPALGMEGPIASADEIVEVTEWPAASGAG